MAKCCYHLDRGMWTESANSYVTHFDGASSFTLHCHGACGLVCLRSDIHKNSTCATALSNRLAFIKYSNTCSVMYNSLRLEVNVSGNSAAHQRNKLKHVCSVNAAISAVFHHYAGIIRWKTASKWSAVSAMFNRINTSGNNVQVWVDVIRSMISIKWHIFRTDMMQKT